MKRKPENLPIPMQMLKDFEKSYPGCWHWVEHIREGKGKDLPDWDDMVYIPLTGTNEILRGKYNTVNTNVSCLYAALAAWRQYKEIYSFSPELIETLFEQSDEDIVIPMDILKCMPYPCIYIATDTDAGFFVYWEQDMKTKDIELRFSILDNENRGQKDDPYFSVTNLWLHVFPGATVGDGIRKGAEIFENNIRRKQGDDIIPMTSDDVCDYCTPIISKLIQLVLYICAENAEVEENPETKPYTRKPKPGTPPKDVRREIRTWDVGVKFASNVRKARESMEIREHSVGGNGERNSPRPHTRRGHWHHYWTGSETAGNRKLILKWTAPIFVGGNRDDTITTINEL